MNKDKYRKKTANLKRLLNAFCLCSSRKLSEEEMSNVPICEKNLAVGVLGIVTIAK